jgi:hypothetical protein
MAGALDDRAQIERRPRLALERTPKTIAELTETHQRYASPERWRAAEGLALERRLSDLVNRAYRLTDDEVALLWRTAPPRIPQARLASPL